MDAFLSFRHLPATGGNHRLATAFEGTTRFHQADLVVPLSVAFNLPDGGVEMLEPFRLGEPVAAAQRPAGTPGGTKPNQP
jgi:hypothetical protein